MNPSGPNIKEITEEQFREFAKRHATSPEIGPIGTALDSDAKQQTNVDRALIGLWGCDTLCAVACFNMYQSAIDKARLVLKLDSVIVASPLRRRGLAGLLVAGGFAEVLTNGIRNIVRIYAHSVHPATVRLLRTLGFRDPQATGAPISDLGIEAENREAFLRTCETQIREQMTQMRLQCEFCRKGDKRARPWCTPRGELPKAL